MKVNEEERILAEKVKHLEIDIRNLKMERDKLVCDLKGKSHTIVSRLNEIKTLVKKIMSFKKC